MDKIGDKYKCSCGCDDYIVLNKKHVYNHRHPLFISGHSSKVNHPRGMLGKHHDSETRLKLSISHKGKPAHNKGISPSVEVRRKISESLKGRVPWNVGIPCSDKVKKILTITHLGKPLSEEHRKKISVAKTGLKFTKEHIENWKNSRLASDGFKVSTETRRKLSIKMRGDKCNFWQGGITNDPYSKDFNKLLKEEIRTRDNNVCQVCGTHQEEQSRLLPVHHIDYNKKNCNEVNLITLCDKCHAKTNSNRKYWEEYFTKLMISKISFKEQWRLK